MGGLGKTQIVLEYLYQALGRGFHGFWVNCTTPETLNSDFQKLKETMMPETRTSEGNRVAVLRWLESHDNWVLVFDNADDSNFSYEDWIPDDKGNPTLRQILFTTRDERLAGANIVNFKENIPLMSQAESVDLFNMTNSTTAGASDRSRESVLALVERLGKLSLAITLASAYLREYSSVTVTEYLKLLKNFSGRSKLFRYKRSFSNYNHSIMSTWEISFIKVQADNPQAAEMLTILRFLENKGVPFDRLKRL
ncbi:tetratricopeptide repeat protein [Colletotrichum asianum]